MKTQVKIGTVLASALLVCLLLGAQALAVTPKPAWSVQSLAEPTNFEPGEESGLDLYEVFITNSGGALTDGTPITITDTLPAGLEVKDVALEILDGTNRKDVAEDACAAPQIAAAITTLTCTIDESLPGLSEAARFDPLEQLRLLIRLSVPPEAAGTLTNQVQISGGGAESATVSSQNQASSEPAGSGFQEFRSTLTDAAGQPASGADSHPYAYTTSFALNTELTPPGSNFPFRPAQGDLRNIEVPLPPGLIANPTAIERCTIAQFNAIESVAIPGVGSGISLNQCPDSSAAGVILIEQLEGGGDLGYYPIYNLEPPRGMPAQLGFQVLGLPFYINARLRSDSDYGVTGYLQNVSEAKRVTASVVSLWGVPWAPVHDRLRGNCAKVLGIVNCPAGAGDPRPLWRLPSSCAAELPFSMSFDTWLDPGDFKTASLTYPAPTGCELPPFEPTVEARPTTNVADAPSGLHFNLHLPQAANEDPDGLAHADLRDATVLLPEGFVVNPSSADGLEACTEAEVGYRGVLEGRHAFSADPARCPDGSKIGNVSVSTPLVDHPLPGAVYLATPHRNPFDSLIAIYIAIEDPQSGVVVKLAGEVSADPASGRLQTTVEQNPQTPFEDFTFDFFEGARAPLRTPATCGVHTTTTTLTPWTAPASPSQSPTDSFQVTQSPGGGCPTTPSQEPHAPGFEAGTITPLAGAYSPFALRLSRADGSQELNGLDLTLPPGLSGKLAGLGQCPEQALTAAASHSGREEQSSASCPAASQLGTVTVAAGAGPAPYRAQGNVYLAGPYKGAPISMAVITPAVAGPFDLGTVVVRAPLYIDPESARIRALSDPLPTILQGIPLDVRSIVLRVSRDQFTLNPTSCDPLAFSGLALSALGQAAPLAQRFQVGGCEELSFGPKLALRLKGPVKRTKNPRLIATYTARPGEAAAERLQVKLPASAFLDNDHIRTICTRVQFAADTCPAGSIYGKATATTPLLAEPLSGPVILRSSSNPLPDLVVDLHGPPALPIRVALVGRTDSVKGALRNTFEGLPDVPAGRVRIELFGGNRGLIEMSGGFCRRPRAAIRARAQSGAALRRSPKVAASCPKGKPKKKGKRHTAHRRPAVGNARGQR